MTLPTVVPGLVPLAQFDVSVGPPVTIDAGPNGRRFIPITGGTVSGRLHGVVLPGGDWQSIEPDGRMEISAHYALDIEGHGLVEVQSDGVRHGPPEVLAALARGDEVDPSSYYFRTAIRLRTAAVDLLWLNSILAISVGVRRFDRVQLSIYELT